MPYKFHVILYHFLFFLLIACKKENTCLPSQYNTSIIELDWQEPICLGAFDQAPTNMEQIIHLGNQFSSPAFNPNNPYEFCYYQVVADSGSQIELDHQIVTFNLQTGTKTIVLNNTIHIYGNLAWNKNGWIAYQNEVGRIFAINITTQETIQMSVGGEPIDKNLVWLNNGDTLIWGWNDLNGYSRLKSRSIHADDVIDLINGQPVQISDKFTLSSNNMILARNTTNVAGTNFSLVHINEVQNNWNQFSLPLYGSAFGRVNWHVDGNHFYVPHLATIENSGLFEVDFQTMDIKKIYEFCDKQIVNQAVCSPNEKYLIIEKTEREYIINVPIPIPIYNQIVENKNLWLYNLQTGQEAPLPLD